jgi:carbamoyltransferase
MDSIIWGISANSHDAAISVLENGRLIFAAQSERYSKKKNDAQLDSKLIIDALRSTQLRQPNLITWYEKPYLKSLRQLKAGQGFKFLENNIGLYLKKFGIETKVKAMGHHQSHAAGAYFTSPFNEAAILVIDAIGEFDTTTIWHAKDKKMTRKYSSKYPNSIGLWYSAMTQRIGLKPNEEEYILMGMAAYGDPDRFYFDILEDFFKFDGKGIAKNKQNLHRGCLWWRPDLTTEQDLYDIAAGTQAVYELLFNDLLLETKLLTNSDNLVLSGGCALNCVANNLAYKHFKNVWIMPNPGDAGSSMGSILAYTQEHIPFSSPYLGHNIEGKYPVEGLISHLKSVKLVGVANGKAEFGPRALGNRSLLADPRGSEVKNMVNEIKRRQKFRPFAPSILQEYAHEYFDMIRPESPYMQFVMRCKYPEEYPAIIHVDGTSRVQTVTKENNSGYYKLLKSWYEETGCPMLLNTSLNIKGQPIINDREDANKFEKYYGVKVL